MTDEAPILSARIRALKNSVLSGLFLLGIWLPTLDGFFQWDHSPQPNENRRLAQIPEFRPQLPRSREFFVGLEAYFSDHFGFRKQLIHWNHQWRFKWFRESRTSLVIEGKNGWHFYSGYPNERTLERLRGQSLFDEETLSSWCRLLESRRDWLAKRGIAYLFVVPPDKHTVYPEFLPDWVGPTASHTKLGQFMEYMKTRSNVPVLDLRQVLIEAKKHRRVYQLHDTHWTPEGGFVTYQILIQELAKQLPGLAPLDSTQFSRETVSIPAGDLAALMGRQDLVENNHVTLTPLPPLEKGTFTTDTSILEGAWPKHAEPGLTENPRASGKAILFRDSFSSSWAPYLCYHFNRVVYIWQNHWNPAFIEREKPDVVIDEILERFLSKLDPKSLMAKEGLK
jgi:alginate O-acetyltransferase complex protein AlgJ